LPSSLPIRVTDPLIALFVLPAVLALLGHRVNALAPAFLARRAEREARPTESGFWYRLSRVVQRFPGRIAVASAALLVALRIPFLSLETTAVDAQVLPTSASARQVDDTLRADFPPFRDTPVTLAVRGSRADAQRAAGSAARVPGAAAVAPPTVLEDGVWAIDVISAAPPLAAESRRLVEDLRTLDGDVLVTGFPAAQVDLRNSLSDHLPLFLALVAGVTIVLFAMTGSVLLPLKQVLMNVLGLSAVRDPRPRPSGRSPRGAARLHKSGRARLDAAAVPVRRRVWLVERLRRVPARAHQGGARPRPRRHGARRADRRDHRPRSSSPRSCSCWRPR
jgi:RND superfamily putative drug exporter